MTEKVEVKRSALSVEEWVDRQTFTTTADIDIPDMMADRVIGQEDAVEVMKKAASQKRHVMLIGEPGTGKSMLANSMVEYLPKEELQDIVAYHNPEDFNEPRIRTFPAGKGKAIVAEQKAAAAAQRNQKNTMYIYACVALLVLGLLAAFLMQNLTIALIALFAAMIIVMLFRNPGQQRNDMPIVPKVIVGHEPGDMPPLPPVHRRRSCWEMSGTIPSSPVVSRPRPTTGSRQGPSTRPTRVSCTSTRSTCSRWSHSRPCSQRCRRRRCPSPDSPSAPPEPS